MPATAATDTATAKSTDANPKVDKRLKVIDVTMKRNHYRQDALIEVLHKAQEAFGYLEPEILEYVARHLKLPLSRVYGVATFYHLFSLKPSGEHTCVVAWAPLAMSRVLAKSLTSYKPSWGLRWARQRPTDRSPSLPHAVLGLVGLPQPWSLMALSLANSILRKHWRASRLGSLESVPILVASLAERLARFRLLTFVIFSR